MASQAVSFDDAEIQRQDQLPHQSPVDEAQKTGNPNKPPARTENFDIVQVASEGSFPASDPPPWTSGRER